MRIDDVNVLNWKPPGNEWWKTVEARPGEPLIEVQMTMMLSWDEYQEFLRRDEVGRRGRTVPEV